MRDRPVPHHAVLLARVGWLILPVVTAGFSHVVVLKTDILRGLAMPIDGNARWRGQPVFGTNKTWRGVVIMTGLTALATRLQSGVGRRSASVVFGLPRDYRVNPWLGGGIMGLSYCLAELPNSFVKRRLRLAPGEPSKHAGGLQYAIDQADSVAGCLIGLRLFYSPRRGEIALAFALGTAVHMGVDQLLIRLGVKRRGV